MFVSRGPAPEWLARCSVGLVFGLFVCALFVAALFSGFRVVGCPKSASRLPTSGFVHFVGLVFGLFVCALFVAAVFSEFRVRWLPGVNAFRQCFVALRRVGVWSVCLCHVCYGPVLFRFRDVRLPGGCAYMVRTWFCRVGVWSFCLRPDI